MPADLVGGEISGRAHLYLDTLQTPRLRGEVHLSIIAGIVEGLRLNVTKLLGARQTFQKPFDMEKLVSAIRYELAH